MSGRGGGGGTFMIFITSTFRQVKGNAEDGRDNFRVCTDHLATLAKKRVRKTSSTLCKFGDLSGSCLPVSFLHDVFLRRSRLAVRSSTVF